MGKGKKQYLFVIDLDGTLLKDSAQGEMHQVDILAVKKLIAAGHIVCIATGRPWRSTQKTYEELGLKTLVANYNGAQIHNPYDYSFTHNISYMNLNDVLYVMGDKKVKNAISNVAIEGPSWVMLDKRDKNLERVFGFAGVKNLKIGFDIHRLPLKPTGVIFDIKKNVDIRELSDYLKRTYGDLAEFSWWSKGEGLSPVFDMTNVGVTKARALSLMARYYDIPLKRTVAIGDGYNDLPMFRVAEISVAMANSAEDVQALATYTTKKTNKAGGVADFINDFLGPNQTQLIKRLSEIRKKNFVYCPKSVKAH